MTPISSMHNALALTNLDKVHWHPYLSLCDMMWLMHVLCRAVVGWHPYFLLSLAQYLSALRLRVCSGHMGPPLCGAAT